MKYQVSTFLTVMYGAVSLWEPTVASEHAAALARQAQALWSDEGHVKSSLERRHGKKKGGDDGKSEDNGDNGQMMNMLIETEMGGRSDEDLTQDEQNFLTVSLFESFWITHHDGNGPLLSQIKFDVAVLQEDDPEEALLSYKKEIVETSGVRGGEKVNTKDPTKKVGWWNPYTWDPTRPSWEMDDDPSLSWFLMFEMGYFLADWFCLWDCYHWGLMTPLEGMSVAASPELQKKMDEAKMKQLMWSDCLCDKLRHGPYDAFHHVHHCKVITRSVTPPAFEESRLTSSGLVSSPYEKEESLLQKDNTVEMTLNVRVNTDNLATFTEEEKVFIADSIYNSFRNSHSGDAEFYLKSLVYETESHGHGHKPTERVFVATYRTEWGCKICNPMTVVENDGKGEAESLERGLKKSSIEEWQLNLCTILTYGPFPIFKHVINCEINIIHSPFSSLEVN